MLDKDPFRPAFPPQRIYINSSEEETYECRQKRRSADIWAEWTGNSYRNCEG